MTKVTPEKFSRSAYAFNWHFRLSHLYSRPEWAHKSGGPEEKYYIAFDLLYLILLNLYCQPNLLLWMGILFDSADAALKDVRPSHFQETGNLLIRPAKWQSMKNIFLTSIIVNH